MSSNQNFRSGREAKRALPKTNQKRRSRRNRRRARARSQPQVSQPSMTAPMSVAISSPRSFHKQIGSPRHKEWGIGCRFSGCVRIGALGTTNLEFGLFQGMTNLLPDTGAIGPTDLWASIFMGQANYFGIHPSNIPRLNREALNWSRYCFRKISLTYHPACPSTLTGGFTLTLSRDTSMWFQQKSYYNDSTLGELVANTEPNITANWWNPSSIRLDDYKGDRTWPCSYPTYLRSLIYYEPAGTVMGDLAEDYFQAVLVAARPFGSAPGQTLTNGFLFLDYEIDLYQPTTGIRVAMSPISGAIIPVESQAEEKDESKDKESYASVLGSRTTLVEEKEETPLLTIGRLKPPASKQQLAPIWKPSAPTEDDFVLYKKLFRRDASS